MGKNLVLCADGTCNAFGASSSSNVARLIEFIDLRDASAQVVVYDQGLGTFESEHQKIVQFKKQLEQSLGQSDALLPLRPPAHSSRRLRDWPYIVAAMTAGWGLETNVGELYAALAEHYQPGDRVFLFGFSRGAFTVRALAGFVWRYGIPPNERRAEAAAIFTRLWPFFRYEFPDEPAVGKLVARALRDHLRQIDCPIHFMGLWDTVKSYGGLWPIMLPHLRHNPSVRCVRHALALDERRGWFESTTWGWLDSDHPLTRKAGRGYPVDRLDPDDRRRIEEQDIQEVWFTGCHADVGGGNGNRSTSDIALRWMLGEANARQLMLNKSADKFMAVPAEQETPTRRESRNLRWALIEACGRQSIDNGGLWPVRYPARGASPRAVANWRDRVIWVHESVADRSRIPVMENRRLETAHSSRSVKRWSPDALVAVT